jgi:hypothetical protein
MNMGLGRDVHARAIRIDPEPLPRRSSYDEDASETYKDGKVDFLEFEPHEWFTHPNGDDLPVSGVVLGTRRKLSAVLLSALN